MNVTGIADLGKVRAAAETYKTAILKQTHFFTCDMEQGMVGTGLNSKNKGETSGALLRYKSDVIEKMNKIVSILDKLIASIDSVNKTYTSTVTAAAISSLNKSGNNIKS